MYLHRNAQLYLHTYSIVRPLVWIWSTDKTLYRHYYYCKSRSRSYTAVESVISARNKRTLTVWRIFFFFYSELYLPAAEFPRFFESFTDVFDNERGGTLCGRDPWRQQPPHSSLAQSPPKGVLERNGSVAITILYRSNPDPVINRVSYCIVWALIGKPAPVGTSLDFFVCFFSPTAL